MAVAKPTTIIKSHSASLELYQRCRINQKKINPELEFAHIVLNPNRGLAGASTPWRHQGVSFYLTLNPGIQYAMTMLLPDSQFYDILSEYKCN